MNATAVATRTFATFAGSSHTYVQKVRDAVAESILVNTIEQYSTRLQRKPQILWEITTLLVDETDSQVRVGTDRGTQHILMLAAVVYQRLCGARGELKGPEWREDLVLPPAAVQDTTSLNIVKAITMRAGWLLERQPAGVQARGSEALVDHLRCVVFFSDSAASLIKIGCHYVAHRTGRTFIWSGRCFMHKLWSSIVYVTKPFEFINPMF